MKKNYVNIFRPLTVSGLIYTAFVLSKSLWGTNEIPVSRITDVPQTPRIGILSQPDMRNHSSGLQYIAASYPKWLEAGGARSIPIPYDADPELLDKILAHIHGLLLPGGASRYPPSVRYMLNKIYRMNQNGSYFPVWGTCLGFEFLVRHFGPDMPSLVGPGYEAENVSLPLETVLRRELYDDDRIFEIASTDNVTMNNHQLGVDPDSFERNLAANSLWEVTSTNIDQNGRPFVSTIEPRNPLRFPFYGIQYHPEKNMFEYATYPGTDIPYEAINHSPQAIHLGLHLSRFFVDNAQRRKVQNVEIVLPDVFCYPTRTGLAFEQEYLTPAASDYPVGAHTLPNERACAGKDSKK